MIFEQVHYQIQVQYLPDFQMIVETVSTTINLVGTLVDIKYFFGVAGFAATCSVKERKERQGD